MMKQGRDCDGKGQAGVLSTSQAQWHHPALLLFLPAVEGKALPGVTAWRLHSMGEERVENKACTGLSIEAAILK